MMIFNKVSVGLELDSCEARVVEISNGMPRAKLLKWGRIPMPEGIIKDGVIVNSDQASEMIKKLFDVSGIKTKSVMLGVLNQDVIIRFAAFPKVEEDKLRGLIQFQAQEFFPMPLQTLILDFMVVDEFIKDGNEMLEVLLVAAKKTMIEGFVKACEKAQLRLRDIDVSTLSLIRLISDEDHYSSVALSTFYNEMAGILLLRNGIPRLSRIIPVNFKNKLDQKCFPTKLAPNETGSVPPFDEQDVQRWSESLSEEINSSIDFYQSQKGSSIIGKAYICGSGIRFNGLMALMEKNFDIPLKYIDTKNSLDIKHRYSEKMKDFEESDFAVCISLALRGLEEQ
jgi:type IV pilus assembly protein PilM